MKRYRYYSYAGCFGPGGEILPSCTPAKAPSTIRPTTPISSSTIQPGGEIKQPTPSTSKFDISAGQSHPTTTTTHAASPNNKPQSTGTTPGTSLFQILAGSAGPIYKGVRSFVDSLLGPKSLDRNVPPPIQELPPGGTSYFLSRIKIMTPDEIRILNGFTKLYPEIAKEENTPNGDVSSGFLGKQTLRYTRNLKPQQLAADKALAEQNAAKAPQYGGLELEWAAIAHDKLDNMVAPGEKIWYELDKFLSDPLGSLNDYGKFLRAGGGLRPGSADIRVGGGTDVAAP